MSEDSSYKVGEEGYSQVLSRDGGMYSDGYVVTPNGFVVVYAQGGHKQVPVTRLDFMHAGRVYTRHFKKCYSRRYIKTLAMRFAADIVGKDQ